LFFLPYNTDKKSTSIPEDVSFWETQINYLNQDGVSRSVKTKIAYKFYTANKDIKKKENPLIFLHGVPGAFAVNLKIANDFYKQFTNLGYDVYLYDQSGSGSSTRLDDIADYSYKYLVAELEKIRELIKSEKLVIVGESWGGGLGSSYNAYYPERVEKIIFINPVEIETPKIGDSKFDVSKTSAPANMDELLINEVVYRPRALISVLWLQNNFNSVAVKSLLPDSDADFIADTLFTIQSPDAVCKGAEISPEILKLKGNGFWVQQATNNSLAKRTDEPISKLKATNTSALLISSECDFIPEVANDQYKEAYKNLQVKYIEQTGHIAYFQKFDETTKIINNFIK
jgi:proline iminopeptidase